MIKSGSRNWFAMFASKVPSTHCGTIGFGSPNLKKAPVFFSTRALWSHAAQEALETEEPQAPSGDPRAAGARRGADESPARVEWRPAGISHQNGTGALPTEVHRVFFFLLFFFFFPRPFCFFCVF